MTVITTKILLLMIQRVLIQVGIAFSGVVPGSMRLNSVVFRIGYTIFPITGKVTVDFACFLYLKLLHPSMDFLSKLMSKNLKKPKIIQIPQNPKKSCLELFMIEKFPDSSNNWAMNYIEYVQNYF
jgi:hypothetical protein